MQSGSKPANSRPWLNTISAANWGTQVLQFRFLVVHVGAGTQPDFDQSLYDYLSGEYPERCGFAYLSISAHIPPAWWNKRFGEMLGKISVPVINVKPGYYLFDEGKLVGHVQLTAQEANLVLFGVASDLLWAAPVLSTAADQHVRSKLVDRAIAAFEPLIRGAAPGEIGAATALASDPGLGADRGIGGRLEKGWCDWCSVSTPRTHCGSRTRHPRAASRSETGRRG